MAEKSIQLNVPLQVEKSQNSDKRNSNIPGHAPARLDSVHCMASSGLLGIALSGVALFLSEREKGRKRSEAY